MKYPLTAFPLCVFKTERYPKPMGSVVFVFFFWVCLLFKFWVCLLLRILLKRGLLYVNYSETVSITRCLIRLTGTSSSQLCVTF